MNQVARVFEVYSRDQDAVEIGELYLKGKTSMVNSVRYPQRGSPITPIVAGKQCIGFVFPRGRVGFEAFDEEKSLGLYQTRESAIAAVIDAQRAA